LETKPPSVNLEFTFTYAHCQSQNRCPFSLPALTPSNRGPAVSPALPVDLALQNGDKYSAAQPAAADHR